jgi:hypothetical protein
LQKQCSLGGLAHRFRRNDVRETAKRAILLHAINTSRFISSSA